jgi:hypothetical protein
MIRMVHSVAVAIALSWTPATEAASPHKELIGAPVYAADDVEVGRVADVSTTGNQIDALRVSTGARLGFGERIVVIPQPAFMIRRGRVLLPDLRAEDVGVFPDASTLAPDDGVDER